VTREWLREIIPTAADIRQFPYPYRPEQGQQRKLPPLSALAAGEI